MNTNLSVDFLNKVKFAKYGLTILLMLSGINLFIVYYLEFTIFNQFFFIFIVLALIGLFLLARWWLSIHEQFSFFDFSYSYFLLHPENREQIPDDLNIDETALTYILVGYLRFWGAVLCALIAIFNSFILGMCSILILQILAGGLVVLSGVGFFICYNDFFNRKLGVPPRYDLDESIYIYILSQKG